MEEEWMRNERSKQKEQEEKREKRKKDQAQIQNIHLLLCSSSPL